MKTPILAAAVLTVLDVNKSPVSSTFGYDTGGQEGIAAATSFSIFF